MKVAMIPTPQQVARGESGINTVVRKYAQHLPKYGVQIYAPDEQDSFDLIAIHAGMRQVDPLAGLPVYAHLHGMYWTQDYPYQHWQHAANASIVQNLRFATRVSVPSRWVAKPFERDMRFSPDVIPHGVDWDEWQHSHQNHGYVLWAKNRVADVCDPSAVGWLARAHKQTTFVTTFPPQNAAQNIRVTGVMKHQEFRETLQKAAVYLSTTEETFGVATLEALAAGTPVLGYAHGGNLDLVEHGVTGYLARPFDLDDLAQGLEYCLTHRAILSVNAREAARKWSWEHAAQIVVEAYTRTVQPQAATVSVIVPVYNKTAEQIHRALASINRQNLPAHEIIVVDDGSQDARMIEDVATAHSARCIHKSNGGVATARNRGGFEATGKYLCFLDADDWLADEFLETCVHALEQDNSLHLAYTGITTHLEDGREILSQWPAAWDFDQQLKRKNQVPTCNVMRAETFRRLGGYRQRYAPTGAGAEDAELWLRMGVAGYRAALVTAEGLFHYSLGQGHTARGYQEPDWLVGTPSTRDQQHPFASHAKPLNGIAHPVTRYRPQVSVIIPVGRKHGEHVLDALDSLEAQTYRAWEGIVVEDTTPDDPIVPQYIRDAFPHVTWLFSGGRGAGAARNVGADAAQSDFLLYLDADDNLKPESIRKMVDVWGETQSIVYTDYLGIVYTDQVDELVRQVKADPYRKLVSLDAGRGEVVIYHEAARQYDCEKAQRQPELDPMPYLWCLVTCLVPRAWHIEVGGFDESMESWEDADYHWRLARLGHCYARVPEALVVYRFNSGERRELGGKNFPNLLKYLQDKYKELPAMGCGCKNAKPDPLFDHQTSAIPQSVTTGESHTFTTVDGRTLLVSDGDLVDIVYQNEQRGAHKVIGGITGIVYGRRDAGDRFIAHKNDVFIPDGRGGFITSNLFVPLQVSAPPLVNREPPPRPSLRVKLRRADPAADAPIAPTNVNLDSIPNITPTITKTLVELGISTVEELVIAGEAALIKAGVPDAAILYSNAIRAVST